MNVLAFFTVNGNPGTGLIPTVRIRDVADNSLIITDATSSEVGDGWYVYDFTAYDSDKEYAIRFDGGPTVPLSERYTSGTNDSFVDDISEHVWDEQLALHGTPGSAGSVLSDVGDDIKRLLGLTHENMRVDETVYDDDNNLVSAKVRAYSNPTDAKNGTNNNIVATYRFEAEASGPNAFTVWKQIRL